MKRLFSFFIIIGLSLAFFHYSSYAYNFYPRVITLASGNFDSYQMDYGKLYYENFGNNVYFTQMVSKQNGNQENNYKLIHLRFSRQTMLMLLITLFVLIALYSLYRLLKYRRSSRRYASLLDKLSESKDKLDKDRNMLLTIINNIPDMVYVKDRKSRFIVANPPLAEFMCDGKVEELIGKTDFDFYPENVASILYEDEQRIMSTGVPIIQKEEHLFNPYGKEIWVSTSKVPLRDSDGRVIGIVGIGRDITTKKLYEQKMQEQERKIKQYLDIAEVIIVALDRDGKIQLLNRKGCEILGVKKEDVIDKDWFELFIPEEEREKVKRTFVEIINGRLEQNKYYENKIINSKGEKRIIAWHNALIKDPGGNVIGTLSSGEDVTEKVEAEKRLKETEKKLEASQRLEAIGRLTSGIAHDFNNLLSVIIGYSDLLKMKAEENATYLREIEEIKRAGEKAASLIGQLLAFSRKQATSPKIIDLNRLIKGIEKILSRTIGEDIELIINLSPDLDRISIDPSQMEQIIMNLVVNAKHAMPKGGRLTIETKNVYLDENYAETHPGVVPGNYVMLSVSDTGVGMDEETREHIFEPFFTTRKNGLGTGLGLSTVYGIVKQNEGSIWVYSEPGKGTIFKIYLPKAITSEKEEISEHKKLAKTINGVGKKVLIVEDEEQVRSMVFSVLEASGFEVTMATNGKEGLDTVKKIGIDKIDLIITDMIMPEMGGYEFFYRLRELYPDTNINILFVSGYSEVVISKREFNGENFSLLQKPFTADKLLEKVKEMLQKND